MSSTHVAVLRQFSGFQIGEVADSVEWIYTDSLVESRHILRIDKTDVDKSVPCAKCKKKWLTSSDRADHLCADDDADTRTDPDKDA